MERGDGLLRRIPGVALARSYRRKDLARDLTAGVVLATMLVPQGMAYAELTGLPAETGLYTTVAALLAYAVFGTNRVLVLGPDSSLAPIIAAIVLPMAAGDPATAVVLASALSLITGLVCLIAGYARLGVVTELLSKPVRIGYLNGIAVVVLISQLPKALGFSVDTDTTISTLVATFEAVVSGEIVLAAMVFSILTIVLIQFMRRLWPVLRDLRRRDRLARRRGSVRPGWCGRHGRCTAPGCPGTRVPESGYRSVAGTDYWRTGRGADLVCRHKRTFDRDGAPVGWPLEIQLGGQSARGSKHPLRAGPRVPTSASSSRTAVAMSVGSRTQLTGAVAAVGVLAMLVWAPGLLADLPSATLAAIVISASFVIFDGTAVRWLWSVRRSEFLLSLGSFLGVVIVGPLGGILIAIALSLANFIRRAWHPHSAELVRVQG